MYYNFKVEIPTAKGIIIKKKGKATYILYQYGNRYNAEKKYAVPLRSIIGKMDTFNEKLMFPNEKFQEYFPDVMLTEKMPEINKSCCLRIGLYAVIRCVIQEDNLAQILSDCFQQDLGIFLDLISYLITKDAKGGLHYSDYAFTHPLFSESMPGYNDVKISNFLDSITKEQVTDFLDRWNDGRDHKKGIYISYIFSNSSYLTGDIGLIDIQTIDDHQTPLCINTIAFDETDCTPLYYEEYPGSMTDVSQFSNIADEMMKYGYHKIGFILNQGYFSKDSIRYIDTNRLSFIIMVNRGKGLASSLIEKHLGTFETNSDCYIPAYNMYGKTVMDRLYVDDSSERYFHLYFNSSKQVVDRRQLENMVDKMKLLLDKHLGKEITLSDFYHEYFNIQYSRNGKLISYMEREVSLQREYNLCGYFCIITSEKMTASEALNRYAEYDIFKQYISMKNTSVGSNIVFGRTVKSFSAITIIDFISLIVRNQIYNHLKEMMSCNDGNFKFMTVREAIQELEKIEMVRRSNGLYRLGSVLTRKQRMILSAFGISDADIRSISTEIGRSIDDG